MTTPREKQLAPPGGWLSPGRVRLPPLTKAEATWSQRALSAVTVRIGRVNAANLFLMLLRNPRLFWRWLLFAQALMPYGRLPRRITELAILRVAWNCRSRYEWGQHVDIGLRADVPAVEVARVAQGPNAVAWDAPTRAVLCACDEVHADKCVSDDTWQTLSLHFRAPVLMELLMLINHYEMLAGVLISTGIELDASIEEVLANAPIHQELTE